MFRYVISLSEHKFASKHETKQTSKQKKGAGKKTIKEKQTILLESMQCQPPWYYVVIKKRSGK